MANQFDAYVPSALQALMAGEQSFRQARSNRLQNDQMQARQDAAQIMSSGGDPRSAIARLLGAGDVQGASTIANIGNNERDFAFRQQQADRQQGNADRSFGLQQTVANKPVLHTVKDANGNETLVQVSPDGKVNPINAGPPQPTNPYSYGKMNENQAKDSGYANRMFESEKVLRDPKLMQASQSLTDRFVDRILPGDIANNIVSEGYQKYDQAARDFINATLRRESGAAISQSEFDNAYKQYLPRPGDTKEVLQQKARNRQATIASIAGGGGPAYRPPAVFDAQGNMVPSGNPKQGVAPTQGSGPVKVGSPAERDALAPGTQYIAPDGTLRTKQ